MNLFCVATERNFYNVFLTMCSRPAPLYVWQEAVRMMDEDPWHPKIRTTSCETAMFYSGKYLRADIEEECCIKA